LISEATPNKARQTVGRDKTAPAAALSAVGHKEKK